MDDHRRSRQVLAAWLLALVLGLAGCSSDARPEDRAATPGAPERHRLLTTCGLGMPTEFRGRFWVPADRQLRSTSGAPPGFTDLDEGTMRLVEEDRAIYVSSGGVEVEYEPARDASANGRESALRAHRVVDCA